MPRQNNPTLDEKKKHLEAQLSALGQSHVLRWWPDLSESQRAALLAQLDEIDLGMPPRLVRLVESGASAAPAEFGPFTPPPCVPLSHSASDGERLAKEAGEKELRAGRVAIVTVAGGQGTRLRFRKPKGMYPISPVLKKTLFQLHAERILALARKFGAAIPWAIMTSDATDRDTREYFQANNFLGLAAKDVLFFRQGMMPALDAQRKLVLTDKHRIFLSPNGHGGTIRALASEGILAALQQRGIRTLFYFQVDNPAVDIAAPAFIGHHILKRSEMSIKVMRRRNAEEPIGVMVQDAQGKLRVIEYSDLDEKVEELKNVKCALDEKGRLKFLMGSPAIHILDVAFIQRLASQKGAELPFHVAHKPVPFLSEDGRKVFPQKSEKPNGCKFEMFIFDALPLAAKALLVEMDRNDEFAPVKRVTGEDSAKSCRRILCEKYARWLQKAGVRIPRDPHGNLSVLIEISPLYALDADELARRLPKGFKIAGPELHLS